MGVMTPASSPSKLLLAALALLALPSCSSTPVNAAGSWAVNVTNGANGCSLDNWTAGETTSAVPLQITQSGSVVTAVVGGATGTVADLVFGTRTFNGSVNGNDLDARLVGRAGSMGGCAFTPVIDLSAQISGDTMMGTLVWSYDTNSNPDCGMMATCESIQAMNGSRPPTAP
jgi:hypothetical protein